MLDVAFVNNWGAGRSKYEIGRILESMLYYGHVNLIINSQVFNGILASIGPEYFQKLLKHDLVTATITPEMMGIQTNHNPVIDSYRPVIIKLLGDRRVDNSPGDVASALFSTISSNQDLSSISKKQVKDIVICSKRSQYSKILKDLQTFSDVIFSICEDSQAIKMFIESWAEKRNKTINYPQLNAVKLTSLRIGDELCLTSDIPLNRIVRNLENSEGWASIIAEMQNYAMDLHLSFIHSADIVTSDINSSIAKRRIDLTVQRSAVSADNISCFEDHVFGKAHAFAQAFAEGVITFDEALKIIDGADKFKSWIRNKDYDSDILSEYIDAISKDTKLKRLPFSLLRFSLFNGSGYVADWIAPGSSVVLSAIDNFLIERLLTGWKPNVFVRSVREKLNLQ